MKSSEFSESSSGGFPRTVPVFDYTLSAEPVEELANWIVGHVSSERGRLRLYAVNPAKVVFGEKDPTVKSALRRAEVLFPDGLGICWASRLLSGTQLERVPGVDLATALLSRASDRSWGVYLLGARPGVNTAAAEVVRRRFPKLSIVGAQHGYFNDNEQAQVIRMINEVSPQLLLVALGSPAQELWIDRHFEKLDVGAAMGVGGTFDVYAGAVPRAPEVWREFGLEWLHRILREPRRIKRFLDTHPYFVWRTFRSILS